ncbi:putative wing apart-like protein [Helianthus anomalus]
MEGWLERYSSQTPESKNIINLENPMLLLKCLKIMENATFLINHLLGAEDDDYDYRHVSQSFTKLILSAIKILSESQKSSSVVENDGDQQSKFDLTVCSQQESSNVERNDSPQASCSHVDDVETFNLFADCLLSAVKVNYLQLLL